MSSRSVPQKEAPSKLLSNPPRNPASARLPAGLRDAHSSASSVFFPAGSSEAHKGRRASPAAGEGEKRRSRYQVDAAPSSAREGKARNPRDHPPRARSQRENSSYVSGVRRRRRRLPFPASAQRAKSPRPGRTEIIEAPLIERRTFFACREGGARGRAEEGPARAETSPEMRVLSRGRVSRLVEGWSQSLVVGWGGGEEVDDLVKI